MLWNQRIIFPGENWLSLSSRNQRYGTRRSVLPWKGCFYCGRWLMSIILVPWYRCCLLQLREKWSHPKNWEGEQSRLQFPAFLNGILILRVFIHPSIHPLIPPSSHLYSHPITHSLIHSWAHSFSYSKKYLLPISYAPHFMLETGDIMMTKMSIVHALKGACSGVQALHRLSGSRKF